MYLYIALGIAFVIIAGIVVVVVSQMGRNKRCPHCRRMVSTEATVCPYCTQDLS